MGTKTKFYRELCNAGKNGRKEEKATTSSKVDGLNYSGNGCVVKIWGRLELDHSGEDLYVIAKSQPLPDDVQSENQSLWVFMGLKGALGWCQNKGKHHFNISTAKNNLTVLLMDWE